MRITSLSHVSGALALTVLAPIVTLAPVTVARADVNVGPLACMPTAKDSAASTLVYHEHYLINPPTATQNRKVVCNIPFDSNTLPATFQVGAFGLNEEGAISKTMVCYANVIDMRNQHVPTTFAGEPFLDNPGQDMAYTKIMSTKTKVDYLWSSWATLTRAGVMAGMMDPPATPIDPVGNRDPKHWTISVNCTLKPGQALNMVSLFPTTIPAQ